MEKKSKYTGNMCNLHPLKTKSPKYCLGIFLDYNFLSDILSAKLTKFAGYFPKFGGLSDRLAVFAKTELVSTGRGLYQGSEK